MSSMRFLVPNGLTAASLVLGLASVTRSAAGDFELAAWMILWSVLLDNTDGAAARLLGAGSRFGAQLDSFADLVSFGVAPAALAYFHLSAQGSLAYPASIVGFACAAHVLANACRLARFNISSSPRGPSFHQGITTTLTGALLASFYLVCARGSLPPSTLQALPFVMMALSVLMVSTLPLPKLQRRSQAWLNVLQAGNAVAIYACGIWRSFPEYILAVAVVYPVVGISVALWTARERDDEELEGVAEPL